MKNKQITVIGAGYAGLSIAALLAKDGHRVRILEKLDQAGGRARLFQQDGFSFDMGPSWYMMPEVFERYFDYFGKKPSDYYQLKRLDPQYRMYFGQDEVIDISSDLQKNVELFERLEPGAGKKFLEFLEMSQKLYDTSLNHFIYRSYDSLKTLADPAFREAGMSYDLFLSLDRLLNRYFKDERIKKILSYTVVFLGGNPKNTPGMYALMSHVDFNLGVWYPMGGMNAVAKGIESLCTSLGVEIHYNQDVKEIMVEHDTVKSVVTKQETFQTDLVVNSGDYQHGETALLRPVDQTYPASYWEKRVMAPSAFIVYLGLKKKISGLKHHTLMLAHDWQEHFDQIFDKPQWPDSPSFYVCNPVIHDPQMAPEGKDNLFILVPVAPGLKDDEATRELFYEQTMNQLESILGESVKEHVEVKRVFAHKDFKRDYHSYRGSALGLAHTLRQSAMFRPKHRSKKVKGLYYTGQYVHPGIGVPMVLIASDIVYGLINEDIK